MLLRNENQKIFRSRIALFTFARIFIWCCFSVSTSLYSPAGIIINSFAICWRLCICINFLIHYNLLNKYNNSHLHNRHILFCLLLLIMIWKKMQKNGQAVNRTRTYWVTVNNAKPLHHLPFHLLYKSFNK